jgi:large subunit ribosomal protein L16
MLMPRRTKYRKQFRGRMRGKASRGNTVQFGDYGLQSLAPAWVTSRQIEAARRAIVRYVKRGGRVVIRIFPDKPVTQKPAETRMGSGKGAVDHWVAVVRPGTVMFEIAGVTEDQAREAFRLAGHKLPMSTQFVARESLGTTGSEG